MEHEEQAVTAAGGKTCETKKTDSERDFMKHDVRQFMQKYICCLVWKSKKRALHLPRNKAPPIDTSEPCGQSHPISSAPVPAKVNCSQDPHEGAIQQRDTKRLGCSARCPWPMLFCRRYVSVWIYACGYIDMRTYKWMYDDM